MQKPLLSLVIFTYNQQDYIKETLEGAFAQKYSPLEIIISDDCSTDNNFEIIEEMVSKYDGPHTIILNRNANNFGEKIGEHVNKALSLTKGKLLILTGGDDVCMPERVDVIYDEWITSDKKIKGFFSNVQLIDKYGNDKGVMFNTIPDYTKNMQAFMDKARVSSLGRQPLCWLLGCSSAIDREVFDVLGDVQKNVLQEDGVLAFRSLLLGEIKYIDSVLLKYRRHGNNTFEPENNKKVLYLLKREYYFKLQWYIDAKKLNPDSPVTKVTKIIAYRAYIFNLFLKVPMAGKSFLLMKKIAKKIISK